MTMKLLHALILVLTALLFLVRKKYLLNGVPPMKREPICPACGDTSFPNIHVRAQSDDCYLCTRAASIYQQALRLVAQPKYKRDPDITVDNEDIGQHNPHDHVN